MNHPALYFQSFNAFKHIYPEIFDEFDYIFKWKEADDTLLDIGCGPGNVTRDILLSIMPANFSHITGVDCSDKILQYARTNYSHPKISYKYLDIGDDMRKINVGKFDHIVSFNCLHWVKDIEKAFKNIFELLQPGGDCLLALVYKGQKCQTIFELSKNNKWSKYFINTKRFLPILFHSDDPIGDCEMVMKTAGFKDVQVYMRKRTTQTTMKNFKDMVRSIELFYEPIPEKLRQEYLNDAFELARQTWIPINVNDENDLFPVFYRQIICLARK